jgi:hypothetical protein
MAIHDSPLSDRCPDLWNVTPGARPIEVPTCCAVTVTTS